MSTVSPGQVLTHSPHFWEKEKLNTQLAKSDVSEMDAFPSNSVLEWNSRKSAFK